MKDLSHKRGRGKYQSSKPLLMYDRYLFFTALALLAMGLLMVTSASLVISDKWFGQPFHFLVRQGTFLLLGLSLAAFILQVPSRVWLKISPMLLGLGLLALVLVLIPGIGRAINGSKRWLHLGPLAFQVSEFVKLTVICYLAGYLHRHNEEVRTRFTGFLKPMILLGLVGGLLLCEPDFGATVVIVTTAMGMMFLAGVRLSQFALLIALVLVGMASLAIMSPYRMARLTSFLDPWSRQFDSGYQLTQSLIAFGRGGFFGVGLGGSIQKLFYLPEAHTDFLFAVLAEELGLFGCLVIIFLFVLLVGRAFFVGMQAQKLGRQAEGYLAYGIGFWMGFQVLVNIGVSTGVLPTKGLTLPLMSYGGSSLLINCLAIALLLRIDYENRKLLLNV